MTTTLAPQDARDSVSSHLAITKPHADLAKWLGSRGPDKAIAAMMVSAASKKPQKVGKRLSKPLAGLFGTPKVVKWDKTEKFVYGAAFTAGDEAEVLKSTPEAAEKALFQTDLYLRTRDEHTEINAVTVAAITETALAQAVEHRGVDEPEDVATLARQALTQARIFSTGLEGAKITAETPKSFLVPFGDDALEVENFAIARNENGKAKTGQILSVRSFRTKKSLDTAEQERIGDLASAMTKAGHPGAEAFAEMVLSNARDRG